MRGVLYCAIASACGGSCGGSVPALTSDQPTAPVPTRTGVFLDSPVAGLRDVIASHTVTNAVGEFVYRPRDLVGGA